MSGHRRIGWGVRVFSLVGLTGILLSTTGCPQTKVTETPVQGAAVAAPAAFYIQDFHYDDGQVKQGQSVLPQGGIIRRALNHGSDPKTLVRTFSTVLVKDLTSRGYAAYRLAPGAPSPAKRWLVGGEFLEIEEGNRMRRALIGFGSGETEMQVGVDVAGLEKDPALPFTMLGAHTGSGKMPGAAITLNP